MKKKVKTLLLILVFTIVISITFGCTEEAKDPGDNDENNGDNNEAVEKEVKNISAGFIKDKYLEDDNMMIEFSYTKNENNDYNNNLVVKTEDEDLFDELELLDHKICCKEAPIFKCGEELQLFI
ncbi:MAG: hypothetical protein ACTHWU_02090 [Senegalia sp. (in: firmicutes)]|uniref:hypothetical protein n=1 Tax=Senegalia sp. (in: firmicutes) TaxID=1924098 RepID=UPI003F964558